MKLTPELEAKIRTIIEQCCEWGYERELLEEIDLLRIDRDKALNALSVTQEEWLLRTKHLEAENYQLKEMLKEIDLWRVKAKTLFEEMTKEMTEKEIDEWLRENEWSGL